MAPCSASVARQRPGHCTGTHPNARHSLSCPQPLSSSSPFSLPLPLSLFLLLIASSLLPVHASSRGTVERLLSLGPSSLEEAIRSYDTLLVTFYNPGEAGSTALLECAEEAARALAQEGWEAVFAKVDAKSRENKGLLERYGTSGPLPQVLIFQGRSDGQGEVYSGPVDAPGMTEWLRKRLAPSSLALDASTLEDVEDILKRDGILVVGVFDDFGSKEFKAFSEVAASMVNEYVFRHTTDINALPGDHPVPKDLPFVRVLKDYDEGYIDTQDLRKGPLEAFIHQNALPLVVEYSGRTRDTKFADILHARSTKKAYLLFPYAHPDADRLRSAYSEFASTRPDGIDFFIGDAHVNAGTLEYFSLTQGESPCIIVQEIRTEASNPSDKRYYKTTVDPEEIVPFITNVMEGKERQQLKSAPIPESNEGPVKVVVARTLYEAVLDSGRNVLLEFYAPWCGHCTSFEAEYERVGEALKDDPDIMVAKMDFSANDIPKDIFRVEGIPKFFFCSSNGTVVEFDGVRTAAGLIKFVNDQRQALAHRSADSSKKGQGVQEEAEGEPSVEELAESRELQDQEDEDALFRDSPSEAKTEL